MFELLVSRWVAVIVPALLVSFALMPAGLVSAQDAAPLSRFRAAPTPEDDFQLSRPTDLGHLRFGAQVHADYANDPLIWVPDRGPTSRVVGHQLNLDLGLSLGLFDRVVVFAGLPVTPLMRGDDDEVLRARGAVTPDGPGLGDAYLGARARVYGAADDPFAFGVQVTATFPTAGDQRLRGESSLSVRPTLLAEVRPGRGARIVVNLGAIVRRNMQTEGTNLALGDELSFGLGFSMPVFVAADARTHLDAHAQIYGGTAFADVFGRDQTALEATLGLKFFHARGVVAGLAAGPGLTAGFGSPDVRVIAMVGYTLPAEAASAPPPEPPGDRDGDGLLDDRDACPDEPEDVDGFEDADGCPDPDDDADGVPDAVDRCPREAGPLANEGCPDTDGDEDGVVDRMDQCPNEPEDHDGFEDADGCPDPDNDGDGLADAADACPNEAGPAANRGCPDGDRDGDGVIDRLDNCPDVPGTAENHGCPTEQLVRIQDDRLEILDVVHFATSRDEIHERSFELLENVARVLNAHPEIQRVRVEGHTDTRGRREANLELSQRRAEAVVRFLVDRCYVAPTQVEARGFGSERPIIENARGRAQHAQNRRVEFNIIGPGDDGDPPR